MRILAAILLTTIPALAHDAPAGWAYDSSCCSNKDCRQESDSAVRETPHGYRIVSTGELIQYGDARIKRSGDEHFHRCASAADFSSGGMSICLYVPDRGF